MAFAGFFRRPPPLAALAALDTFVDRNAAFLVQKCLFEYSRARAGLLSQALFKEEAFRRAVEEARWRAYPIGVGLVAEMVEGQLRPLAGADGAHLPALEALAARVIVGHPRPAFMQPGEWEAAREGAARRVRALALAPVKPVKDVPLQDVPRLYELMPIHESLMLHDFELVQNNLRVNLCRIHEDFLAVADLPALAAAAVEAGAAASGEAGGGAARN